jgi:hypothetical protein
MFKLPEYIRPDFSESLFSSAPSVRTATAPAQGQLPDAFYATTIYPEYFKIEGQWRLIDQPRMDCAVIIKDGLPRAVEARRVCRGDAVVVGREEDLSNGVYVDHQAFLNGEGRSQHFAFRTSRSRESSYSRDYDELYDILRYEHDHGTIVWVLGPAVAFDYDARRAMQNLIQRGYVHALLDRKAHV